MPDFIDNYSSQRPSEHCNCVFYATSPRVHDQWRAALSQPDALGVLALIEYLDVSAAGELTKEDLQWTHLVPFAAGHQWPNDYAVYGLAVRLTEAVRDKHEVSASADRRQRTAMTLARELVQ